MHQNKRIIMWLRHEYGEGNENVKTVIEALEKQIPRKVNRMEYELLKNCGWEYACPVCGYAIGKNQHAFDYTETDDYCAGCGQKLDWGE